MGLTQNLGRLSPSIFSDASLNIGVGAAPSGSYKFEVTGTSKVSGVLTLGATLSNGTYTYTLPSATGTLALTSALTGYVPYTGATADVNLGIYTLTASGVNSVGYTARGSGTLSGYLIIKQGTTYLGNVVGYNSINANSTKYTFISDVDGTNYKSAIFELSSLTNNTDRTYTLPDASGTIALVGGSGVGTVTSVAALTIGTSGTDLSSTVATSTTTPVITLNVPTASATNRGALSSADWTTFNSKQGTITLTTTGTSGAATFSSNTLNIPNYGSALSGYLPLTGGTLTGATSISYSAASAYLPFNITNTAATGYAQINLISSASSVSGTASINYAKGLFFRLNSGGTDNLELTVNGGTSALLLNGTSGAATFSSSVFSLRSNIGTGTSDDIDISLNVSAPSGSGKFIMFGRNSSNVAVYSLSSAGAATFSSSVTAGGALRVSGGSTFTQGEIEFTNTASAGQLGIFTNQGTSTSLYFDHRATGNAGNFVFRNGSGGANTLMYIAGSGNVGIGTTSPSYLLDVNGTGRFSGDLRINNNNWLVYTDSTATARNILTLASNDNLYLQYKAGSNFYLRNTDGDLRLTIASTGAATFSSSVGIGASPASLLYAYSSTSTAEFRLERGGVGDVGARWKRNGSDLGYISNADWIIAGTSSTDFGVTAVNNLVLGTAGNARVTITSAGRLDVAGEIRMTGSTLFRGMSSSTLQLCGGTSSSNIKIDGSVEVITMDTNGATRLTIATTGNVLIGTTDDGGRLVSYSTTAATQIKAAGTAPAITFSNTVLSPTIGGVLGACTASSQFLSGTASGDMVLANQFSGFRLYVASYSGGVYLTSGATSWTANSDIRLKNINSHIENAVEKLSTLQTINFSYKDDKFKKQNLGLIAQEVEKIFPELIDKNNDGMLGVRYTELVPVLIKAIQELKLEIETLKNK
jgi:hypothetical protein